MNRAILLAAAATLLGAAAPFHPGPPRMHAEVGTPAFEPLLRLNGMSEAGIKALRGAPHERDAADLDAARCAVDQASLANPLDVAALGAAIERRDALAATQAERHRTLLIGWLGRLDAGDATVLLHLVGTGEHGGPGGPPPPPGGHPEGPPPGGHPDGPPPGMGPRCPA